MIGILIFFSICVNPMQLAWETLQSDGLNAMEYVLDLLFAGDIVASFNTAYFSDKDDAYMTQRPKINKVIQWLHHTPFSSRMISMTPINICRYCQLPLLISTHMTVHIPFCPYISVIPINNYPH